MPYDGAVVGRWLSAILTIVFVVLGSRPAGDAISRPDRAESEAYETTHARAPGRSSKRSGVRARDHRRGSPGELAILPDAITLPTREKSPIDERVWVAIDHSSRELHPASARAPPGG
jgi:hypothetical protein